MELVTYHLNDDADARAFLALNRDVGATFTGTQPGFVHREIGKNEEGEWIIAISWETAEDARNSIANIDNIPEVVKS